MMMEGNRSLLLDRLTFEPVAARLKQPFSHTSHIASMEGDAALTDRLGSSELRRTLRYPIPPDFGYLLFPVLDPECLDFSTI